MVHHFCLFLFIYYMHPFLIWPSCHCSPRRILRGPCRRMHWPSGIASAERVDMQKRSCKAQGDRDGCRFAHQNGENWRTPCQIHPNSVIIIISKAWKDKTQTSAIVGMINTYYVDLCGPSAIVRLICSNIIIINIGIGHWTSSTPTVVFFFQRQSEDKHQQTWNVFGYLTTLQRWKPTLSQSNQIASSSRVPTSNDLPSANRNYQTYSNTANPYFPMSTSISIVYRGFSSLPRLMSQGLQGDMQRCFLVHLWDGWLRLTARMRQAPLRCGWMATHLGFLAAADWR